MQNYTKTLLALRGKKYALIVLALLSVSGLIWSIIIIFATQTESSVSPKVIEAAKPLKPYFNTQALESISERTMFSDEELQKFKIRVFEHNLKTKEKQLVIIE